MTKNPSTPVDFFTPELAERYDERNSKLSAISDNLHFLIRLTLERLPARSKILSVGAGTGADILSLAKAYPEWTFVAVEPSLSMLNVAKKRIQEAGFADRCEFVHGYSNDLPTTSKYDAALAVFVAHFIKREDRIDFYKSLVTRLLPGGILINTELSFDLESPEFPSMLKNWESIQKLMGGTPESLASLPQQLREILTVLPPNETEELIRRSGIDLPTRFFQSFIINGWYGIKNPSA